MFKAYDLSSSFEQALQTSCIIKGKAFEFVLFSMCLNFSQVTEEPLDEVEEDSNLWNSFAEEEEEEGMVFFVLEESTGYMAPALRALAVIHTVISFVCVIGYYCLKASS